MRMGGPVVTSGEVSIEATFGDAPEAGGEGSSRIDLRFHGATPLDSGPEAALVAGLLPAMRRGEDLHLDAPVSPRLLEGVAKVQEVFTTWDRTIHLDELWYRRIEVTAPGTRPAAAEVGRGTACFFTGGVDSFHTVIRNRHRLDALIFVHGFDVDLGDRRLREVVSARLRSAADELGLPLVEVEANLQEFGLASGVSWGEYHGAALATVALLLSPRFERVLVPATHTYGHLEGLGSHPLLDPLWSTEAVEIVHDGADADRIQKLALLADEPVARAHLRVCWSNPGGAYNCGTCEKCVRTSVAARIAGVEDRFPTLTPPSLARIGRVRATGRASAWHELHGELIRTGASPRLRWAVEAVIVRHQLSRWKHTKRWFG